MIVRVALESGQVSCLGFRFLSSLFWTTLGAAPCLYCFSSASMKAVGSHGSKLETEFLRIQTDPGIAVSKQRKQELAGRCEQFYS